MGDSGGMAFITDKPASAVILAGMVAVALAGCERPADEAATPTRPAETRPAGRPDIPLDGDLEAGRSPILVKPLAPGSRAPAGYLQDKDVATGSIRGLCFMAAKPPERMLNPAALDVAAGPAAVTDPEAKELDYYGKIKLSEPAWVRRSDRRRERPWAVMHAVLMVRGVKAGPVEPLARGAFEVSNGQIHPLIGFSPVHDRVSLRTLDAFSGRFVLRALPAGETLWEGALGGNTATYRGTGAMDKGTLGPWELNRWKSMAKQVQTDVLREPGFCEITCRRHPWQRAYVVVLDNPYAVVPGTRYGREGVFTLADVPVGEWTFEAWHPLLEPVTPARTVTIKENEVVEVLVEFKSPAAD